jgi:hypothetical protein
MWGSVRNLLVSRFSLEGGDSYAVSPSTSWLSLRYAVLEEELDEFDAMVQ